MIDVLDIQPGESYACKYKVNDEEKFGLILLRDVEQKLVKIQDLASADQVVVSFDDIWDVDEVEWFEKD